MNNDSIKKILEEIIAAQDEVTANKIIADLQKSFMVRGAHGSKEITIASSACVGVSCNGLVDCIKEHTECSPHACNTFGGNDHDCKPVACGSVSCPTMGNYSC